MNNKIYIRDFYGRIIGSIEDDLNKKEKIARDFYGRILGTYDIKSNITRDFYGRIIGYGDILTSLIYQENEKKESTKGK
jgi:hypothetical protein